MRVLVTGGTSLLGAGVARLLAARGDDVTVLQRGPSGLPLPEVRTDVADPDGVRGVCDGHDAVVHLAAKVSVSGEWQDFVHVNVRGTENMVAEARRAGVQRFVQVSSPSVAHSGEPLVGVGADPADPENARGPYARSKAQAELVALRAGDSDLSVVAVRPHLVWGPGDTQLVGRIVQRARSGRLVLVGGGVALIDSTYVDNAVTALVAALDQAPRVAGEAFVVSNGEPRTVAELLARICRAAGVPAPTRSVPTTVAGMAGAVVEQAWDKLDRGGEPPMTRFLAEQLATAHWFDQRRTRSELQWTPHVSLDEGFRLLAEGMRPTV